MIQSGCPLGSGSGGPGYRFWDEFHPALRHDDPGVLSRANSGLHSNGSQFFITLGATPWLDDLHSVFGRVVAGQSVVEAIGAVETDAGDRPLTTTTLLSIRIERVGAEAEAFDGNRIRPATGHGICALGDGSYRVFRVGFVLIGF